MCYVPKEVKSAEESVGPLRAALIEELLEEAIHHAEGDREERRRVEDVLEAAASHGDEAAPVAVHIVR